MSTPSLGEAGGCLGDSTKRGSTTIPGKGAELLDPALLQRGSDDIEPAPGYRRHGPRQCGGQQRGSDAKQDHCDHDLDQ